MTDAKNNAPQAAPKKQEQATDLPEQLRIRRDKRAKLIAEGGEAYPVEVPRTHTLAQVREQWGNLEAGEETQDVVTVVGRVIFVRNTGKLCFATLQEGDGTQLQGMLSLKEVGEDALAAWKADVDLGDFVILTGRVICRERNQYGSGEKASTRIRP
ncbi:OB-fold nucleic acid binding domain-containing protein, partial [uncultured Corynebacterium sp.]|uniref:OB-fold nucleic acid binding domain-containing protein n=1 Tax=uncultured Corynebacterium sp. TaxID=159447 RepID=UPI002637AFCA